MSDPARLTEVTPGLRDPDWLPTREDYAAMKAEAQKALDRLAATENVIRRATLVASWKPEVYTTDSVGAARELQQLREAVAAYDAQKEPTGNHAESSATRGDTNE